MEEQIGLKTRNSWESGRLTDTTRQATGRNHITSFDKKPKKHETREISSYESREMGLTASLQVLTGVGL